MTFEQKAIKLEHRIIVLNNKLNELNQSLHVTDVDVNTLDERVSNLENALQLQVEGIKEAHNTLEDIVEIMYDEVHKRTSISANKELHNKYDISLECLREIYDHCRLVEMRCKLDGLEKLPLKHFISIGDHAFKVLKQLGESSE